MLSDDTDSWHCLVCKKKSHQNNFPFTLCDDVEIQNLNNSNPLKFCESLPTFEVVSEVSKFANHSANEPAVNTTQLMKFKIYKPHPTLIFFTLM